MKHYFILNPAAGSGRASADLLPALHKYLKDSDLEYEIHRSLSKNDVSAWVRSRAESGEEMRFYAIGGDGTINDVLSGMIVNPNAQLAVFPCGSGNDFVKNFTETKNFLSIESQLNGEAVPVDVIKFNDSYCINMLNIGTDCDIVTESLRLRYEKNIKGAASYAVAAVTVLAKRGTYHMKYVDECGVTREEELLLIAVGNGKYCGGGFRSCPNASIQDGLMDVCVVRPVDGLKLFKMLLEYRNGTYLSNPQADKYFKYMQLSQFTLTPADDFNVSVDGEIEPFVDTKFTVLPGAVKFVVPRGSEIIK